MLIRGGKLPARTIRQSVDRETPTISRTVFVRMNLTPSLACRDASEQKEWPCDLAAQTEAADSTDPWDAALFGLGQSAPVSITRRLVARVVPGLRSAALDARRG
jgi:hypothetical protein